MAPASAARRQVALAAVMSTRARATAKAQHRLPLWLRLLLLLVPLQLLEQRICPPHQLQRRCCSPLQLRAAALALVA